MLKILVADDHYLIRKGLMQLFEENLATSCIDEAEDGFVTLEKAKQKHYDIIVLDISMPGKDGLDVLRDLKEIAPDSHVIILSIQPEEQYAIRAFRLGASGCLNKAGDPGELVKAVRAIAGGKRYLSDKAQELLLNDAGKTGTERPHEKLSDREYQVFRLIASGKTISEISELLSLSVKTVSTYRSRILEKTGFENNAQLTNYAFVQHLVG